MIFESTERDEGEAHVGRKRHVGLFPVRELTGDGRKQRRDGKHRPSRDLPHGRVRKEDGTSFPAHGVGANAPPRRPPILMLFDDLVQDEPVGVFGMYPASFIAKILPWLKCDRRQILHVCSGGLLRGEGVRVDIRPEAKPDVVADGRALPFADGVFPAVLVDPPYSAHYAKELYGVDYPRPSHLLAEAARVVVPGGRIGFVHYLVPNPPRGAAHVKTFGLSMGFGYPMRAVTIYQREQSALPGVS